MFEVWDYNPSIPECSTLEQLKQHQALNHKLFTLEQKHLRNLTNCLVPCNFKKYQMSENPITLSSKILSLGNRFKKIDIQYLIFGFSTNALLLNFVSTEVEIRREAFVYKATNCVAEIGGALGLFLGVSFLSIWDILESLPRRFICLPK